MENNQETEQSNDVYLLINNQIFPINKDSITIGRKLDNDLVIQDPMVSRLHAEIRFEDGKYVLHDAESTGGVFLNNKQVKNAVLFSGDIILLASVPLMFINDNPNLYSKTETQTDRLDSTDKN